MNLLGTVNVFEAVKALCADGASKLKDAERSLQLDCLEVLSRKYVYSMLTCMNLYHVICFVIYLYIILTLCIYTTIWIFMVSEKHRALIEINDQGALVHVA